MRAIVAVVIFAMIATPAYAGDEATYLHNGSQMSVYSFQDEIYISYERPRAGLAVNGVRQGTRLFEGRYVGDRIVGTAFTFKQGCAPAPYRVSGFERGGTIVLNGAAPVRIKGGCSVTGYSSSSGNARLVFTFLTADKM